MSQMIHNEVVNIKEINYLYNTFLLQNIPISKKEEISEIISLKIVTYEKDDYVYGESDSEDKMGFILEGECEVRVEKSEGNFVPLNRLTRLDSFGIISVFSKEKRYPTKIYAKKTSKIMFISGESLRALCEKYPTVSMNVICFLTDRIAFLNDKIATFSSSSVEDKLINYILSQSNKYGSHELNFNKAAVADAISCGRASVYRALEALQEQSLITLKNRKIILNDKLFFERTKK